MTHDTLHFGSFRLDADPDRLCRGSEEIALRPKSLGVLAYLARRPGRLVTKDELREQIWDAVHVSDNTLRVTVREIRAALGEDKAGSRYLETVPGRGYRFVTGPEASSGPESAESPGAERPPADQGEPIVGRRREVEYLLNRFLEADRGRRQLVFLAGEPGAGKTTLVRLFRERLAGRPGTTVVGGQCVMSFGAGEAYGPVLEALGRLAAGPGGPALLRLLDRCAPMWLVQLPAVVESAELEGLQRRVEGATRERMVREANDALERLTAQATLVLVLEDLHWSDVATVELLTSIAQRPEAARLLILGTYRPADAVVSAPALSQAMHELEGRGLCEHLDLELLTRRDVGAYVAARLGGTQSQEVADRVFERSGGNALFMVNAFDHLVQAGAIRQLDDRWVVDRAAAALRQVPEGLRPFIRRRLDTLSAEERRTLETASVVGVEFAAAALSSATSPADLRQDLERLEPTLEALAAGSRLIEGRGVSEWPDGTLSAHYRFHHALYREGLYQEIPEARRARLHRRIGERLRAAFGAGAASLAPVLAVHFENGRDAGSAARYRRLAGERALGRHAYHEAIEHFQGALDAFDQVHTRPGDEDPEDWVRFELDVCAVLGTTLIATRGYADPEAEKLHLRAEALSLQLDDRIEAVRTLYKMWTFSSAGNLRKGARLVARMTEIVGDTADVEARLMTEGARARSAFFRGQMAVFDQANGEFLALYDPKLHGEVSLRYPGISCRGVAAMRRWLAGSPDQAVGWAREGLTLAERVGDPYGMALASTFDLLVHQFRGDLEAVGRRAEALEALSQEQGFQLWLAWAKIFRGWVVAARGDGADGIALMERGLEELSMTGFKLAVPYFLSILARTELASGRADAAAHRVLEARAQVESSDERWWQAELHRLEGEILLAAAGGGGRRNTLRAEACFESALEVARRQQARSLELRAAWSLSRLLRLRRRDEARRLLGGVLQTFSEGHDTADLRAAGEQMARLARTG